LFSEIAARALEMTGQAVNLILSGVDLTGGESSKEQKEK